MLSKKFAVNLKEKAKIFEFSFFITKVMHLTRRDPNLNLKTSSDYVLVRKCLFYDRSIKPELKKLLDEMLFKAIASFGNRTQSNKGTIVFDICFSDKNKKRHVRGHFPIATNKR